jgi:hypothetical protein
MVSVVNILATVAGETSCERAEVIAVMEIVATAKSRVEIDMQLPSKRISELIFDQKARSG